ncbi:P-loop containing nucleoside triphosphate hydrolase protein [Umbelopsis sp. AD052]|nr:P-loop containing nucleoside triphosphate hydrolase protein [Umbelopsis sp. AD052]
MDKIVLANASETERERQISALDRLYLMLQKIGFDSEDIEIAMSTTKASKLTDLLDWLCLTLPDEKLPVGFKDKTYYEDEMSLRTEALPVTNYPSYNANDDDTVKLPSPVPQTINKLTKDDSKEPESEDNMKEWILKAAQNYEEDDEVNVNEQHAQARLELLILQKEVSECSKKRDGDKKGQLKKDIAVKKQAIQQLESDWDYDKKEAESVFVDKKHKWDEESREKFMAEKKVRQKKQESNIDTTITEDEPANEDNEDGLFGLFGDQAEDDTSAGSFVSKTLNIIDVSPRSSHGHKWTGLYPKKMLDEHLRNIDSQSTQTYTVVSPATKLFHASVKIRSKKTETVFSMEANSVVSSKADAQEYVATIALYKLTELPLYRSLPSPYREIWQEWIEQDESEMREKSMELHRKRFRFIIDLIDHAEISNDKVQRPSDLLIPDSNDELFDSKVRRADIPFLATEYQRRITTSAYEKMKEKRSSLPIYSFRNEILELVKSNQIVIVSGETGCGKSTQVPQYLAEAILSSSAQNGNIVCTQPRRISAISIAQRVSQEMGDKKGAVGSKGSLVGYQIRLESKTSDSNILQFCTTGILLRRLEGDSWLQGVTHVVVDEVHERSIESDFLLIILRHLCRLRPDIKILLMSATVDAHKFSSYFGGCPVVQVPGRTFPVEVRFLEDIVEETEYFLEEDSPFAKRVKRMQKDVGSVNVSGKGGNSHKMRLQWFEEDQNDDPYNPEEYDHDGQLVDDDNIQTTYSHRTKLAIRRMDENKINYELITMLLEYIVAPPLEETPSDIPTDGAILIFLPGMPEIRKLYDLLADHQQFSNTKKFILIPLHSLISTENQEKVFDLPPPGMRKIILSTNIAETGVTIEDVTVVIDTGMVKEVRLDDKKRITSLQQTFVSKANAKQRRGRAGRVQSGICFHLFTKERFETKMADHQSPEIVRLPLEELCLRIKACGLGDIHDFLSQALDAPGSKAIDNAIYSLQEVQALSEDGRQNLTPLGRHLSNLPVDVHIGKMLLYGAMFQCLDPILTIAAAMSFKSPFVRPFGKEDEADKAREGFKKDDSDLATIYNAYVAWRGRFSGKILPGGYRAAKEYCRLHYLSFQNLEMIEDMKKQFLGLLVSIGFVQMDQQELASDINTYRLKRSERFCQVPAKYNTHGDTIAVVNAAIAAALYPKFAFNAKHTKKLVYGVKNDVVHVHPSSILFRSSNRIQSNFVMFNTITHSDRTYLWDVAALDDVAVLLFGGSMEILVSTHSSLMWNFKGVHTNQEDLA